MSNQPEAGGNNAAPGTVESPLPGFSSLPNLGLTTEQISKELETSEKMSNEPETGGNNTALGTAISPLPGFSSLMNIGLTTENISKEPETGEKISNLPETGENNTASEIIISPLPGSSSLLNMGLTTENISNEPETGENNTVPETTILSLLDSSSLPNMGLTTEIISNEPETGENNTAPPTALSPLPGSLTTGKISNESKTGSSFLLNMGLTTENISNEPETGENNTAPETTILSLLDSSSLLNMGLTTENISNKSEAGENNTAPPTALSPLPGSLTTGKISNESETGSSFLLNMGLTSENISNKSEAGEKNTALETIISPLPSSSSLLNMGLTTENISNEPETGENNTAPETTILSLLDSSSLLNMGLTTENISNEPETGEKNTALETIISPLPSSSSLLNMGLITENILNEPETGENNTAPETTILSLLDSSSLLNMGLTTENISNEPETGENSALGTAISPLPSSSSLLNMGFTTENISKEPETGENNTDPETSILSLLGPFSLLNMGSTTENILSDPETTEKISNHTETGENNTALGTAISPLPGSSALPNMGLTSTPKRIKTHNRRFNKPKKLLINASADDAFLSCPDFSTLAPDQDDEGKKKDDDKKAKYTPQAKRLSKFLKFSPSHSWVWYEFGDSLVDAAIQRGAYDMGSFMLEYCPMLKTRLLPRRGWQLLRRNLGKARRFSPAFVEVELVEMERSRNFVRQLQQAKPIKREEHAFLEQIYRGVSLPLAKGAKVTTFQKGHGIVNAVIIRSNPEDSTYLVKCVLNGKTVELSVSDLFIQSTDDFVGLSIPHLMKAIDPNEDIFKMETITNEKGNYSDELVESILKVRKLLVVKEKAVNELAAKNDSQNNAVKPKRGQANSLSSTFLELYRVNNEIMPPMTILHEYLSDYKYKLKFQEVRARSALERYLKCCHQAETDMQTMERKHKLMVKLPVTRKLYLDLQTILYLTGELGCPNTDDIMLVTDNLIAYMIKNLEPEVSAKFEATMNELKPLRQRMAKKLKKKPSGPPRFYSGDA